MFFDRRRRVKNLIPKDLYKETSKFVDKNTFVQYVDCFHQTNSNILQGVYVSIGGVLHCKQNQFEKI